MNLFKSILKATLVMTFMVMLGGIATAGTFPSKPLTIIVPYSAGGGTDLQARAITSVARQYLGQPVVVANKSGGGGAVGAAFVAKSRPDGYTLLFAVPAVIVIKPYMTKTPYSFSDLEPLMRVSDSPRILVAGSQQPWKTLDDFIAYARKNPGAIKYASSGPGTSTHIAMEGFAMKAGIKLSHIPFKGCAKATAAILGGHAACFGAIPSECLPYIESGKMRALAVFSEERLPELPDIPTLKEKGIDFSDSSTRAFFVPKGLQPEVKAALHDGFKKVMDDKSFRDLFSKLGEKPAYLDGESLEKILQKQQAFYGEVLEKIGLKKY